MSSTPFVSYEQNIRIQYEGFSRIIRLIREGRTEEALVILEAYRSALKTIVDKHEEMERMRHK
jgi:ribosomal protein L22